MPENKPNSKNKNVEGKHIPILLKESLELLSIKKGDVVVDCTVNRGGHSLEFAMAIGKKGTLICIDLDAGAIKEAKDNLESIPASSRPAIYYVCDNFSNLKKILSDLKSENKIPTEQVDVVYADLGISSQELDISGRGFSFMRDEPLLMTFKSDISEEVLTAYDIVNNWSQESIADVIYGFADERYARSIARGITGYRKDREIKTTTQLAEIIKKSVPAYYANGKTNPATKTFQALRMAVNDELGSISSLIDSIPETVKLGGRVGFITFHSTEDRLVKVKTKSLNLTKVNKRIVEPSRLEVLENPRSRSAKLRVYINQISLEE